MSSKAKVVETGTFPGAYEMVGRDLTVDDPKLGRLYICQQYGGEMTLAGGCMRWRHGFVIPVLPTTTLEQARKIDVRRTDAPNPLPWLGAKIERYVDSLGLD